MSTSINLKLGARKPGETGSPDASAIEMERRIIWIRWLAILVSLGALPFLASSLKPQALIALLALIGLGAIYNLTLLMVLLPRKPSWLTSGYISAIGDVLLVTGGVAVTGGLDSPFFLAIFGVTVTPAVRFGGLAAIPAVLTIALSYTAVVYYDNAIQGTALTGNDLTNLAMRTGFVALTGIFVGFVGDRARRAERALQEELDRAHASLSEVTVELNRDLEFEQTCQLTAEKGRSLLSADAFLLQVQMPPLISQDESAPAASMLYVDWNPELKAQHAGIDLAQKLSVTDSVTGLPNHRYFHTRFDEELERTKDTGGSITVMMIDLDRFKVYNDSFGHAAGDVALKAAARTISSTMRREDTVTRYGGEEFVAILPGVDIQTAPIRAQEICDTLAKVFMYNPKTIFAPLTASVGWATYPVDAKNRDELLNRADLAMYMAKKRGRNCICGASELESVAALDSVLSEVVAQLASADTVGPGMVATLEKRLGQIANSSHLEELAEGMLSPNSESTLEALNALAASIDAKDPYTSGHSQSVAKLAEDLGDMLQLSGAHKNQLRLAAILHDVGKIGVVDKVLLKEGKLDEDEKLIMRMHPILGARILQPIKAFRQILNVVLHHHEWYDGSGYPDGLAGQDN